METVQRRRYGENPKGIEKTKMYQQQAHQDFLLLSRRGSSVEDEQNQRGHPTNEAGAVPDTAYTIERRRNTTKVAARGVDAAQT